MFNSGILKVTDSDVRDVLAYSLGSPALKILNQMCLYKMTQLLFDKFLISSSTAAFALWRFSMNVTMPGMTELSDRIPFI